MPDIQFIDVETPAAVTFSWLLQPNGLPDETQALADAVMVAFNTDAQADVNEILPDPRSDDRRGWWGDLDALAIWGGWPIGSKFWLLRRAKVLTDQGTYEGPTQARAERYTRQALQPFIDNKICSRVDVSSYVDNLEQIWVNVIIYRGPLTAIQLQFKPLWDEAMS